MFVKGGKGGPGRPKNARNVIAGDVKRLMLEAVEKTGDNGRDGVRGYLQMLAREQPALMGAAVLRSFVPAAKEDAPAEGGATIELVMGMVPRGMFILGETEVRAVEEDLARRAVGLLEPPPPESAPEPPEPPEPPPAAATPPVSRRRLAEPCSRCGLPIVRLTSSGSEAPRLGCAVCG